MGDTTGKIVLVHLKKESALSLAEVQVFIKPVEVTGLEIEEQSLTIQLEESYKLNAIISPSNATIKELSWISNKSSVATVDSKGIVKGVGIGSATITATSYNGNFSATSNITVTEIPVSSISISPESVNLFPGDTVQLTTAISPNNASDTTVRWESSNTNIATISTNGLLIARDLGSVTITAISSNNEVTAECEVTVNSIQVSGISLTPETSTLIAGDTAQLNAIVSPVNATNQNVNWESDDITVATVNTEGFVTAIAEGIATVSATTEDGGFKDECIITVSDPTGLDQIMNNESEFAWEGATVEIYNVLGMLVRKKVVSGYPYILEFNDLPRGTYIIIGKNQESVITTKIFK